MQARRRYTGQPESDEAFTIVVDSGITNNSNSVINNNQATQDYPEKEKYPTSWKYQIGQQLYQIGSKVSSAVNNYQQAPTAGGSSIVVGGPTSTNFLRDSDSEPEEIEFIMTARDRTNEFSNAIQSLQSRNIQRAINIRDPRKVKQMQSYGEFMMIAKTVGKNIASTYAKLEKLTMLAKKKSLFDDRPTEIQELTYIIKGDLNSLNQQIARLQDVSRAQRKTSGKHLLSHSTNMVVALQAKLANMSSDFKQILEVRTENLKQQKTRREEFSQGCVAPRASNQPSILLEDEMAAANANQHQENQPLIPRAQQQQLLLYEESDNYLQQRAETMQNIESTIVELGGIFQQLATMVKEQEEMVERIDTNILDVGMNVEMAHGELLKYFQSVTKNRAFMLKIFGVLIFFFLFFIFFMS